MKTLSKDLLLSPKFYLLSFTFHHLSLDHFKNVFPTLLLLLFRRNTATVKQLEFTISTQQLSQENIS